jgi:hypothetical protein
MLSYDELVQEYHFKQALAAREYSIESDRSSAGDSVLQDNRTVMSPRNPVGFGSSSSPRISHDDTVNFPGNKSSFAVRVEMNPRSPEAIKLERRKQTDLSKELNGVRNRIQSLVSEKKRNYTKVKQLVNKIGEKQQEQRDIEEKGTKLYIAAANTLSMIRSQQAAKLIASEEAESEQRKLINSPEEVVRRCSMVTMPKGRRSSTVMQMQLLHQQHVQQKQQTPANSMVRAANVSALKFQRLRDNLWTKAGQDHAQQILDNVERHDRVRLAVRRGLVRFGRDHAEKLESQGLKERKNRPLIKFIRPIFTHSHKRGHHHHNLQNNGVPGNGSGKQQQGHRVEFSGTLVNNGSDNNSGELASNNSRNMNNQTQRKSTAHTVTVQPFSSGGNHEHSAATHKPSSVMMLFGDK